MINAEVVFDGDCLKCNGYNLKTNSSYFWSIRKDGAWIETKKTLEQAIKYCLEN